MNSWTIIANPAYAGKTPRPLQAACHDQTPCIDIRCNCGYVLHQHESRVAMVPDGAEIGTVCPQCGELLIFPPGFFQAAFQQLRDEGWIA